MLVSQIIDRLLEEDTNNLFEQRIAGALDMAAVMSGGGLQAPCAYVIEGTQQSFGEPDGGRDSPYRVEWRSSVQIVVFIKPEKAENDLTMRWAADLVVPVRNYLLKLLYGFDPEPYSALLPVSIVSGDTKLDDGEYLQIVMTFQTTEHLHIDDFATADSCEELHRVFARVGGTTTVIDGSRKTCGLSET